MWTLLLTTAVLAAAAPTSAAEIASPRADAFSFSLTLGDGMVLQSEPLQAMVWGFCPPGSEVHVVFQGAIIQATIGPDHAQGLNTTWRALLPATPASFKGQAITAGATAGPSAGQKITLSDVMFGDVWMCSGQSNMEYPLTTSKADCWNASNTDCKVKDAQCSFGCVNNSAVEVAGLADYDATIRIYQVPRYESKVPLPDTHGVWANASATAGHFSAACWFFGRDVFEALNRTRPLGLIGSYVGGTPDEHWSSPDAIEKCMGPNPWNWPANYTDSILWNAMIVPSLRTTILGSIWYQGEANSRADGRQYQCSFPAMISDWRAKWHKNTDGATSTTFPYGWAQLNSNGSPATYSNPTAAPATSGPFGEWAPGFQSIRLAQSQTLSLPKTFQAVILDTPVASGSVHSPYKQPAGQRLARGGLAMAYNMPQLIAVDPIATSAAVKGGAVVVTVSGLGPRGLTARTGAVGFEVLGADGVWHSTPITGSAAGTVTVGPSPSGAKAVRYLFYSAPCTNEVYQCPVNAFVDPMGSLSGEAQDFLPLGPFILPL